MKSSASQFDRRYPGKRLVWLGVIGVVLVLGLSAGAIRGAETAATIRIGIASGTWQGVNRNDATAAMSAWAKSVMQQRGSDLAVETTLFESADELEESLKAGRVDCASMPTARFLALPPHLRPKDIMLAAHHNSVTENYLLVVPREAAVHGLADLRGRKLLVQTGARMSLALPWLEHRLAAEHLDSAENFFGQVTRVESPTKALLPVFFGKADACLMTSNSFVVAGELNPQLCAKLSTLAASPALVPAVFFFRADYSSPTRDQLEPAILTLHESPAGLQVLTVFQCDRMVKAPATCLENARELAEPFIGTNHVDASEPNGPLPNFNPLSKIP